MDKYGYITDNFKFYEFWSSAIVNGRKVKHRVEPPPQHEGKIIAMATELQKVRDIIRMPIIITSGYRTPEWNAYVGGSGGSYHMLSMAVDTKTRYPLFKYYSLLLKYTKFNGYGYYRWKKFIHSDLRNNFKIFKY